MSVYTFDNIFSEEELIILKDIFKNTTDIKLDPILGRKIVFIDNIPEQLLLKIINMVNGLFSEPLILAHVMSVEYNNQYGKPNLPVHFDGDTHLVNICSLFVRQ